MTSSKTVRAVWLGRAAYAPVHELQHQLHEARKAGRIADTVLFVEHEPTITLGRGAKAEHILASNAALSDAGISVVSTGRGGEITLHAPGQLVCYPILDLHDRQDVRRYVRDLNRVMIELARSYGVESGAIEKYIGLWADQAEPRAWTNVESALTPVKLGAIGVRISRWVTMHGFAFNLSTDLSLFRLIIPCGITEFGVGSIQSLTGAAPNVKSAAERTLPLFCNVFGFPSSTLETISTRELSAELSTAMSFSTQASL
ncbi:MAG TPA: lipoyl(octanoyl) transferase LipB [Polyangiaceae bacterium]|jgi:lipoyl(octanoyl) transferase|nr:lipoyl(octanoyl) transferase LipB [Polyangiaceae bacterium]